MPYALRNRLRNPVLVQPQDQRPLIWRPAGDPSGEDIQMISDELRDDISIRRAIRLGNLELIDNEADIEAAYEKQISAGQQQAQASAEAVAASIDQQSTENVMIAVPCIGPGIRPGVTCTGQAIMPLARRKQIAPLCTEHQGLAPQFVQLAGHEPPQWVRTA